MKNLVSKVLLLMLLIVSANSFGQIYEISGSPFDVVNAPVPEKIKTNEKTILIDPKNHLYGAYRANGRLVRWGIAATGAKQCRDESGSCRTSKGVFRIYSLGNENCISKKYHGSQMPFCMYFNGGEAIHGSTDVQSANISHGCVRVHISDAKWLRYQFAERPSLKNQYRGTKVVILDYE